MAIRRMRLMQVAALASFATIPWGCAMVKPYEREHLADPLMELDRPLGKQSLESKFYSTVEGGSGGEDGMGGGCGCAK